MDKRNPQTETNRFSPPNEENKTISTIIKRDLNHFSWSINDRTLQIPEEITLEIQGQPIIQNLNKPQDKIIWNLTRNGIFNSKTTYASIIDKTNCTHTILNKGNTKNVSWIWKLSINHESNSSFGKRSQKVYQQIKIFIEQRVAITIYAPFVLQNQKPTSMLRETTIM